MAWLRFGYSFSVSFQGEVPGTPNGEFRAKILLAVALCCAAQAVSNPVLEPTAVGKISFRDNRPAVTAPKVAFGLSATYMYSKYLLNTHRVQEAGLELWELEREREKRNAHLWPREGDRKGLTYCAEHHLEGTLTC